MIHDFSRPRSFNPYAHMIYDIDRDISEFDTLPKFKVETLHDADCQLDTLTEWGEGITSNSAKYIQNPEVRKTFQALKQAKEHINDNHEGIVCADILRHYPRDMAQKVKERNRKGEIVLDFVFREDEDYTFGREGQAYLDIGIDPERDPRTDSRVGRDICKRVYVSIDRKVEAAVRDYLRILDEKGVKIKPCGGRSDFLKIIRECLR